MREISLTQGQVAIIDDEDYARVSQFTWRYWWDTTGGQGSGYAVRSVRQVDGRYKTLGMHRFILGYECGRYPQVDHRDGDGLNNRRSNLRACTQSQNNQNLVRKHPNTSSRFLGVSIRPQGTWRASIWVDRRQICLGTFQTEEAAAASYNRAARFHWGEFARLNDVPDVEPIKLKHGGGRRTC